MMFNAPEGCRLCFSIACPNGRQTEQCLPVCPNGQAASARVPREAAVLVFLPKLASPNFCVRKSSGGRAATGRQMVADTTGDSSPNRRRVPSGPSPLLGRMTVRIWPPTLELPPSQDVRGSRSAEESADAGQIRKGSLLGSSPLRNLRERASHVKDEYVKEPLRATAEYVGETRVVGALRDTAEYVGETRVVTTIRETMSETAEYVGETRVVTTIRELLPERR